MAHNHKELEKINVVVVMSGDIAVTMSNMISFVEENNLQDRILFCFEDRTRQRYKEFTNEFRQKVANKVIRELDNEI